MKKAEIEKNIVVHFREQEYFRRKELLEFYKVFEPELNNRTFGWRVFELKKKKIIRSVGRGIYTTNYKPEYKPQIDEKLRKINNVINRSFAIIDKNFNPKDYLSVWTTVWLNRFVNHQIFFPIRIIEIEADTLTGYYYKLIDEGFKNVYIESDFKKMDRYAFEGKDCIVLRKMVKRAPYQIINKINIPRIEKILVDLFCDNKLFYFVQGKELENIYRNAIKKYSVDFSKLLNYSERRKRQKDIKDFLLKFISEELRELLL
ncbi:MAG TPA: hypothetical protein ENI57_04445 [Ignavibacteria bacterium]|nr:hypothetical protein [Ignavibacteria bacterium]